jgi:hypothetical protein
MAVVMNGIEQWGRARRNHADQEKASDLTTCSCAPLAPERLAPQQR